MVRREQNTSRLTAKAVGGEYTFHPEVSTRAQKMRPRSVYELSRGDLHKKETNQRILRLRQEQEELQNLTFQPSINDNKKVRSTLQLLDNPGGFLERHMIEQKQAEMDRLRVQEMRVEDELKECTFVPKTKECPAYVKRIARSLAVVRSAKGAVTMSTGGGSSDRPGWK